MRNNENMPVLVVEHPLAQHVLTILRKRETEPHEFRLMARSLASILVLEATRSLDTRLAKIRTPIEETESLELAQGLAVVPILRAGLAMLEPVLELFPDVAVGYIGLERDERTAQAHRYYCKLPKLHGRYTLCFDPMLATGGSAAQAISFLKSAGAENIVFVCVVAAPQGIDFLEAAHPDVPIVTGAVDRELNEKRYICPGLGDFGDRLYGTD